MTVIQRAVLAALLVAGATASAHDFAAGKLRVEHPWAAPATADDGSAIVYLSIHNDGDEDDRLVAVETTRGLAAAAVLKAPGDEAKESDAPRSADGAKGGDAFRVVRDLTVPAGGRLDVAPGGPRVVLDGLRLSLRAGMRFPLFLAFEKAGRMEVEVWVEDAADHEGAHAGH